MKKYREASKKQKFRNNIQQGFENCILFVQRKKLMKNFLEKQYKDFLGIWAENLRTLSQKLSVALSKLHSTCPGEHFEFLLRKR